MNQIKKVIFLFGKMKRKKRSFTKERKKMDYLVKCTAKEGCNNFHDPLFPCCYDCAKKEYCISPLCREVFPYYMPECPYCQELNEEVMTEEDDKVIENLLKAITNGDLDYFGNKASIDYRGPFGNTVLSDFVSMGNIEVVEELLERGANPNVMEHTGRSVLFEADRIDMFKLLISYGANPEIPCRGVSWRLWDFGNSTSFQRDPKVIEEIEKFIEESQGKNIKG